MNERPFTSIRTFMGPLKTLKLAFNRRWRLDTGKFYLALALVLMFVSIRAYTFTFYPPPENELMQATGKLTMIEMRRGFVYEVESQNGRSLRLTCDRGHDVYCPEAKGLVRSVDVTVKYSPERPELLLSMEQAGKPILAYSFLARLYPFSRLHRYMLGTGLVLLTLFVIAPFIVSVQTTTSFAVPRAIVTLGLL